MQDGPAYNQCEKETYMLIYMSVYVPDNFKKSGWSGSNFQDRLTVCQKQIDYILSTLFSRRAPKRPVFGHDRPLPEQPHAAPAALRLAVDALWS